MTRQRRKPLPKAPLPVGPVHESIAYALDVPCPDCGEPAGSRCTREGEPIPGLHLDRVKAAA